MTTKQWGDLRPEVQQFALCMEERLRQNDHKPGWRGDDPGDLAEVTIENAQGLFADVDFAANEYPDCAADIPRDEVETILKNAVDTANHAMFVWDEIRRRCSPGGTSVEDLPLLRMGLGLA